MRSPHRVHHDAPRQPRRDAASEACDEVQGEIHLHQGMQNGLKDLAGFSHLWVIYLCHHTRGFNIQVQPPRDSQKRGVFATRAPARPNPIGLSCVRLIGVEKRVLRIGNHDMLDGAPVLDLKPYLPYCDSVPGAEVGYVASLTQDAADHCAWWQEKGLPPPGVYGDRP